MAGAEKPKVQRRRGYKKRTLLQREQDTAKILALSKEDYSVREIGELLGLNYATVFRDMRLAKERYKEANQDFINQSVLEMVSHLEDVIAEAWESWFESLEDGLKERIKSVPKVDANGKALTGKRAGELMQERVEEVTHQCGDPRFLTVITRCALAMAKLFESLSLKKTDNDVWFKIYQELIKDRGKSSPPLEPPSLDGDLPAA